MLQAVLKKGKVFSLDVPIPAVGKGMVLIKVVNSCISPGTESHIVKASANATIDKAITDPTKLQKAFNLLTSQGFSSTLYSFKNKLNEVTEIGYSVSGIVCQVGDGVKEFECGDRVAAAGSGLANHAEWVAVPKNLVVKISEKLSFQEASTVALGSIALHGVRRVDLMLGEFCVVIGTGALGLLAVQLLKLNGLRVAAIDLNQKRLDLARRTGAEIVINPQTSDSVDCVNNFTNGYGADAVLFCASTAQSETLSQAFKMLRKKGRLIMLGVSEMHINRNDMYEKELELLMSTSYGPGRYDKEYELDGKDYPLPYVRWTENRNMQEYVRLLSEEKIKLNDIITDIYPIQNVTHAFQRLAEDRNVLLMILEYGIPNKLDAINFNKKFIISTSITSQKKIINVAVVGLGNFAKSVHIPNLLKMKGKFKIRAIVTRGGAKSTVFAKTLNTSYITTDFDEVLKDHEVDLVMITTRHSDHANLTLKALSAGKHVFVEKPLAISEDELISIKKFFEEDTKTFKPVLMVGFNRRFSPFALEIKKHLQNRINPVIINYRVNAGYLPSDHWAHQDGGRIIGEACHMIDLVSYFVGSELESFYSDSISPATDKYRSEDNRAIVLKFKDGSIATIQYFANGNPSLSKEYIEIHFDGQSIVLEDFRKINGFGVEVKTPSLSTLEKGHKEELLLLYDTVSGKSQPWPISLNDLIQTTYCSLKV